MKQEYSTSESENVRHRKSRYIETETTIVKENPVIEEKTPVQAWCPYTLIPILTQGVWLYFLTLVIITIIVLLVFGWNKGLTL